MMPYTSSPANGIDGGWSDVQPKGENEEYGNQNQRSCAQAIGLRI